MLVDAFVLSVLTTIAFITIYAKMPRSVRSWVEGHPLFALLAHATLTIMLLGGTLTALFAGSMVGVMTAAILHIVAHPDDYLYIYDFIDYMKQGMKKLQVQLNEYGRQYRESKET